MLSLPTVEISSIPTFRVSYVSRFLFGGGCSSQDICEAADVSNHTVACHHLKLTRFEKLIIFSDVFKILLVSIIFGCLGLPETFYDDDYKVEETPPCIVEVLCRRHGALSLEAAFAKTYCLRPQVAALLRSGTLHGVKHSPETLLLPQHFETNLRGLDKAYADYVISVGDFDERVFLSTLTFCVLKFSRPRFSNL